MTATESIPLADIRAWRWTDGGSDVEVMTADGWVLYSTGPHVKADLAELRAADVPGPQQPCPVVYYTVNLTGPDTGCPNCQPPSVAYGEFDTAAGAEQAAEVIRANLRGHGWAVEVGRVY